MVSIAMSTSTNVESSNSVDSPEKTAAWNDVSLPENTAAPNRPSPVSGDVVLNSQHDPHGAVAAAGRRPPRCSALLLYGSE